MNFSNNNPIYLEIYHQYKKYIELEVYKPNDKLPSVRALANDLGINPNTVQRAYTLLEDEGFIETLPKKGVYVKTRDNLDNKLKRSKQTTLKLLASNLFATSSVKELESGPSKVTSLAS